MRTTLPTDSKIVLTRAMIEQALFDVGVAYTISPKEATTRCVFHSDCGKPNLYINVDEKPGIGHCFVCNWRGSFVEYMQQVTKWTMVRTLKYVYDLRKRTTMPNIDEGAELLLPSEIAKPEDEEVLATYEFYHPYLASRGLSAETIMRFRVGYDPSADRITFPWFDRAGRLVCVKMRAITEKFYSFPKGAQISKTLFGLNLVRQHAIVWLVEAEIDCMTLDQAFRLAHLDQHYAVALGGVVFHASQLSGLLWKQPTAIVVMLDNDDAGREARRTICRMLSNVSHVIGEYPRADAKDPNMLTFTEILQTTRIAENSLKLTAESVN